MLGESKFLGCGADWLIFLLPCSAWGLGTNGVPLVTAADSQLSVPMNEGGFLALSPTEAPFAGCSPSMSLPSPGSEAVQLHGGESLTMPSRIAFGWPDLDDASRMTVLETFVSNPGTLVASGGNLALMSQAFGLVARVINVKQEARAHDIAGPFDPHCTPWILSQFRRVEAAMDEWWAALPPDMIRGPAWDALATSDNEYSEVVPGVLIVFLMARIQLRSPDDVDVGAGEQGDDQAVLAAKRAWISSPWFLKCAQDARTMAGILRKLYIRNPEALDFMKGVVVKGVYVAGAVLLVVLEQLQAQDEPQLRHAIVRDVKSCVQSLRGVEHGVKAAGQLADLLERGLKPYQVDV